MTDQPTDDQPTKPLPALHPHQRRVLGVLVEKAKTTPDSYPLTLNAIVVAANQKSNRDPQMQLDDDDVQMALDVLRAHGAVAEIQGGGRVNKFRHYAYDWLGVNGQQAAVMIELLLRGPQTLGELRARASRMEKLPDLETTTQVVNALIEKGLVIPLGRPGRGQQFAHTLYQPDERARLPVGEASEPARSQAIAPQPSTPQPAEAVQSDAEDENTGSGRTLQQQVAELTARVERLEKLLLEE